MIGLDYYWRLTLSDIKHADSLVAQMPHLGWMLSDEYDIHSKSKGGSHLLCVGNVSEKLVKSLWELDAIGISSVSESKDSVLDTFNSSISYEGGTCRYIIGLPWKAKKKKRKLFNKVIFEKRLISLFHTTRSRITSPLLRTDKVS